MISQSTASPTTNTTVSNGFYSAAEYNNRTQLMMSLEGNEQVFEVEGLELLVKAEQEMLANIPEDGDDNSGSFANDSFQKNTKRIPRSKYRRRRHPGRRNSMGALVADLLKAGSDRSLQGEKTEPRCLRTARQRRFSNQAA
jgi:hypothetical protein